MKAIVLAGGTGSRLYPLTISCSKQLLPVYDKPMIYYPLSTLMLSGFNEVLLISSDRDLPRYKALLRDGSDFGIEISYMVQDSPGGLPQAFLIGEQFIDGDSCALILGDNLFFGAELPKTLSKALRKNIGASVFCQWVNDPERYGVVDFNDSYKTLSIEEKPANPKSNYAVTGLYFYDHNVVDYCKQLKPSARGELEISDLNNVYLQNNTLNTVVLSRGTAWFDTGTYDSLMDAAEFVKVVEKRQGLKIACLEEIAYSKGWISKEKLLSLAEKFTKNTYGAYLRKIADEL
jgi:glucose-1-phosphate thymidylyltransferase